MPFIPTQPPDDSTGIRYAKAYKYVFCMLRADDDVSAVDPNATTSGTGLAGDLANRFVVLSLPQQISLREPYATVVTVMQDGGKVIESKGQVLKMGSISGTTGLLPLLRQAAEPLNPPYGALIPNNPDLDDQLGRLSGYLQFIKLRYLFRMYGDERRQGNLDVAMHFFDYKNDDFWLIEPESFDMQRSSRRPMSYDYNIGFKCIEYSDPQNGAVFVSDNSFKVLPRVLGANGPRTTQKPLLDTASRLTDMVNSALAFVDHCDAVVQQSFQVVLGKINSVVGILTAVNDVFLGQLNLALSLLFDASSELDFLWATADRLAPDNINQEINEWCLEVRPLVDHLGSALATTIGSLPQQDVVDTNQRFSQGRGKQGSTTDLMQPTARSTGSPDASPFIGTSGLGLITDVDSLAGNNQYTTVIINNGEDIYAIARRTLGSIQRFVDLVLINRLEFPFIVASTSQKRANTLAWGESILIPSTTSTTTGTTIAGAVDTSVVPTAGGTVSTASLPSQLIDITAAWLPNQWTGYSVTATIGGSTQTLIANGNTATQLTLNGNWTITITPSVTTYIITYNTFQPRRPMTPAARAYGTDFLVVFDSNGRGDFAIGAQGDFAAATGFDNFIQAITLRARCPIGSHPFHKSYGLPAPVGRPVTGSVFVLNSFFTRRSLLADPRVGKVRNIQYADVGDTTTLTAEIQPIDSRISRPISVQVGT